MVSLSIDGQKVDVEKGTTILKAAQQAGIEIPYLCYHKDMEPYGGCRICMVEVTENGLTRLLPACVFPVQENYEVKTNTERVVKGRKIIAELLLARCPDVTAVQNLAKSLGVHSTPFKKDNKNCVLCGQCVRVCRNVVNVGAIDFVNRGRKRYVGTPFDLPSDVCIGCGSCAYVCPTGAMNMEYENALRWRNLPGPLRKCRYMRMGLISHKVCPNNYECWRCEVDQGMEDLAETHPVFMLREATQSGGEKIDQFEILFDRFYGEGHIWIKRLNGSVRLGIDDFTRQIIGQIDDIKLPSIGTMVKKGEPLCEIFGSTKSLEMYAPLNGEITHINPDILDNPPLTSIAPYGRGWVLIVKPEDILQTLKGVLSGRSAKEWLKQDSYRFYDLIEKHRGTVFSPDTPIPNDFAKTIGQDVWKKIDKAFFEQKEKRKKVKLHSVEEIFSTFE